MNVEPFRFDKFQFVWVTDRLRFGGCLRWFVGRGLDPSTGGNVRSVRGVGDAAPYIHFLMFTINGKEHRRVKTPPYSTSL